MHRILHILPILILLSVSSYALTPRIPGLEKNQEYMSLLEQEQKIIARQDSIQKEIANVRSSFANASQQERTELGQTILRLETEIFEIRNEAGIITGKINNIEQEFIISQMSNNQVPSEPTTPTTPQQGINQEYVPTLLSAEIPTFTNLFSNIYFVDNLSKADMAAIKKALKMEERLQDLKDKYLSNYKTLQLLRSDYAAANNQYSADTILRMFNTVKALNSVVEDSIRVTADYIFENKVYTYNYLYEKMNDTKLLTELGNSLNKMRNKLAAKPDSLVSDVLFDLPHRLLFLCEQEIVLANRLDFKSSADSLQSVRKLLADEEYSLPRITITERVFIDYFPIEFSKTLPYNKKNPIPQMVHYMKGTVYRILLGSYVRAQPTTIFHNVTPMSVDIADGRHNYYAGAFSSEEEALEAQKLLKKRGFKRPEVVVWVNDVAEKLSTSATTSKTNSKTETVKAFFRVEITLLTEGESLSELHKQTIAATAPNKEMSRGFLTDGRAVFTVGTFSDREEAERLTTAMNAVGGCVAQTVQLK